MPDPRTLDDLLTAQVERSRKVAKRLNDLSTQEGGLSGSGSGVAGRIAIWSSATGLGSDAGLSYAGGSLILTVTDAGTTNAPNLLFLDHETSGTPGVGFGIGLVYFLGSSTTPGNIVGYDSAVWVDATHATRKARRTFYVYDTAQRTGLRMDANGTNAVVTMPGAVNIGSTTAASAPGSFAVGSAATAFDGTLFEGADTGYQAIGLRSTDAGGVRLFLGANSNVDARFGTISNHPLDFWVNSAKVGSLSAAGALAVNGLVSGGGGLVGTVTNASTNTQPTIGQIYHHLSAGTVAPGFGSIFAFQGDTTTTSQQNQAQLDAQWVIAVHATRAARFSIYLNDQAGAPEVLRLEANGLGSGMFGVLGHAAVVKQATIVQTYATTALTLAADTAANFPAGGAGTAAGGWDTAVNRDLAITRFNALRVDVDNVKNVLNTVIDSLQAYGFNG